MQQHRATDVTVMDKLDVKEQEGNFLSTLFHGAYPVLTRI